MKNRLSDLNNHLFAQMERLTDEDMSYEKLEVEIKRSGAVVDIADNIIRNAALHLQAAKIASDYGIDPSTYLHITANGGKP